MPGNFKTKLGEFLQSRHPKHAAVALQASARKQIHAAIKNAEEVLERFGYHIAVVTDTGSMISAKVYGWSIDRDFTKPAQALKMEKGYPINLQLSPSDEKGLTIWSHRLLGGTEFIISSKNRKEILDAIHKELGSQIEIGITMMSPKVQGR
jgi:hypothetical protein